MATYINRYSDEAAYTADASARVALGKSTVSLEVDSRKVHFDGVNVEVSRPKKGDAVYVPSTCVYSTATPGSSVTEGSATFIAGGTVNNTLMEAKGYTAIGTVGMVRGSKCYVIYKTIGSTNTFFSGATSGSSISSSVLSDSDLAKITAVNAKDTQGLIGYRLLASVDVLYAWLTGRGGASKNEGWNGGTDGINNAFLNGADWGLELGPASSSITAHDVTAYKVTETIAKFGTGETGFKKYLESRCMAYPSNDSRNLILSQDGKAATGILNAANVTADSAYFLPAQFAYNHNYTWGSYGTFANVYGLKRGDWFMPGLCVMREIFRDVTYTLETTPTDAVNVTQIAIGGSRLQLNANSNDSRYWIPFVLSRSLGWILGAYGFFAGYNGLSASYRALSVALLTI